MLLSFLLWGVFASSMAAFCCWEGLFVRNNYVPLGDVRQRCCRLLALPKRNQDAKSKLRLWL